MQRRQFLQASAAGVSLGLLKPLAALAAAGSAQAADSSAFVQQFKVLAGVLRHEIS